MTFVLDASVALLWFVPQTNPQGVDYAQATLMALKEGQAVVPSLCALEIANVIAKLEAKGIVKEVNSQRFVALYAGLDIEVDQTQGYRHWETFFNWLGASSCLHTTPPIWSCLCAQACLCPHWMLSWPMQPSEQASPFSVSRDSKKT